MRPIKQKLKEFAPNIVLSALCKRNFNAICLGTPKSGTTSIAHLFMENFRCDHEAELDSHVEYIHRFDGSNTRDSEFVRYLLKRDKRQLLEMEANCFLAYRPDLLYRAFPDRKYLLTIREPVSWLGSIFDNNLNYRAVPGNTMAKWHEFFFRHRAFEFTEYDEPLKEMGLYPLDSYLTYWRDVNLGVINNIPMERLLIISTESITASIDSMIEFLGLPAKSLSAERGRANVTERKHGVLMKLDQGYVRGRVDAICGGFLESPYLPGSTSQ